MAGNFLLQGTLYSVVTLWYLPVTPPSPPPLQNGGMVCLEVFGPYPPVLGWLWYLVVSILNILSMTILISLNLTRIYLIKKVVFFVFIVYAEFSFSFRRYQTNCALLNNKECWLLWSRSKSPAQLKWASKDPISQHWTCFSRPSSRIWITENASGEFWRHWWLWPLSTLWLMLFSLYIPTHQVTEKHDLLMHTFST